MEENQLLTILNKRYEIAEKFTKKAYIDQVSRAIKDYEVNDELGNDLSPLTNRHYFIDGDIKRRYEFKIPLIFTNTEAMKAALFERLPDLIVKGRGKDDSQKAETIDAVYEYLKDKLNLFDFADKSAHWFILTGFCSAQANFESRGINVPVLDENGEPMIDEEGKEITQIKYLYNDPIIEVCNPKKTYYSPDSQFDYKADKTTYYCWEKLTSPEEIKLVYEVEIKADTSLDTDSLDLDEKDDEDKDKVKDLVKLKYYCGELPYSNSEELAQFDIEYNPNDIYFAIFTDSKILYMGKKEDKFIRLGKWYGQPTDFFGFGLGKIGRQFQIEKSIRRGQEIRFADIAAFPKYAVNVSDDISENDLLDPRSNIVLKYEKDIPQILQPGNLSQAVSQNSQQADSDAQKAFGILDLDSGAQNSTVDTATGQTIFAQAASRRVEFAKKKFMNFYRETVILLFKLCQEYWDEDKVISIMGIDGKEKEITVNAESLKDIDFDKDIDIDMETLSINRDVVRQQFIAIYDKTKDDPLVERKNVISDMFSRGFNVNDPDRYIKDNGLVPGTMLVNPQTGEQYQVDEGGEVVSQTQTNDLAQTTGTPTAVPNSQQDLLNTVANPNTDLGGQDVV